MIKSITPQQITQFMAIKNTFIVNIVAAWCSDCTKQAVNIADFTEDFSRDDIQVYNVNVQDVRNVYLTLDHQDITEKFGGHGFPRTVLIKKGEVLDADNVEVISAQQLSQLGEQFKQQL